MAAPKLKYAIGNSASTTLANSVSDSATSGTLTSSTNFQAKSGAGMVIMDEGQATEELAYSTGLAGSDITIPLANRGLEGGTPQAHSAQATVKGIFSALMWNDLIDSLTNAFVASSGAVDATKILTVTGADLNGNEMIIDADADTSMTADTDDQIDWKLGGSDRFRMKTSDFDLVTATANVTVAGADPKRGIYVPAAGMYGATTNGAATGQYESTTNKINVKVLDFDGATEEYAWFCMPAPSYWDLGTVTAEFHWTAASGSGDVIWGIAGLARSNDDALDTALGTAVTVTDTLLTALDEHLTADTSAVTIGGTPAKDDFLFFRVYRDADAGGDTLNAVDARLLGVTIRFSTSQYDDQ